MRFLQNGPLRRLFAARQAVLFCTTLGALCSGALGDEPKRAGKPSTPTYSRDILPILQNSCQDCHRRNHVGPFALETYEQARKRAFDIATVAGDRSMPPWKPVAGFGPRLKHDPSLSKNEVATLAAWSDAGAPRGEEKDRPLPRSFIDGWRLGTPDLVLEMAEDFHVPAAGPDLYRCFVIPTNLRRDVNVSAVEYLPGNRRVVHHMMAFLDTTGAGRERDAADPGPGYTSYSGAGVEVEGDLGGWAAGNVPHRLPDGIGRPMPARSDVLLQVHYHPGGKPEVDRTRLGVYFCKQPVRQTLHWANATNDTFRLPPGKADIVVKASWNVPVDVEALAVTPHMHQLGRSFQMTAISPGGKTQNLLHIDAWDPNWQNTYFFEKRIALPKGSIVKVVAHFDNSAHPRNPHSPPRLVRWGPEASDEMCVGYIGVVKKGQDLTRPGEKDDLFDILAQQYVRRTLSQDRLRGRR
jgi:Copper type II ascorbate-dependent monooxygenase, C-terminal domain